MRNLFEVAGEVSLFGLRAAIDAFRRPFEGAQIVRQLAEVGSQVASAGDRLRLCAWGGHDAAHAQHSGYLRRYRRDTRPCRRLRFFSKLVPGYGLLVAGRVGSGIGAVLANMRATEQIDGIESLSIDSFKFLVVPRIVACTLALPILTLFTDFSGLLGGLFSEYATSRLSPQLYLFRAFSAFEWSNFWPPTLKTCVFGFTIGTISSLLRLHHK